MDSLLLAAVPAELAGLDETQPPGWQVAFTGVGALAAAVVTARLLAERPFARVLFAGTCGAYDDRLSVGDLLSASSVVTVSLDVLEGRAYQPSAEVAEWAATWTLPFPPHAVAVTPAITSTVDGARRLALLAAAEHLELTGVFAAAHAAGVPVAGALAVANRVGPDAHAEWVRHNGWTSRALMDALRPVLRGH
jgi:purine-nucleoside phosphorylase